jgi:hypothetical protein
VARVAAPSVAATAFSVRATSLWAPAPPAAIFMSRKAMTCCASMASRVPSIVNTNQEPSILVSNHVRRHRRSSRMMLGGAPDPELISCGFLAVGLVMSLGLVRVVRSCGFDGLALGDWPTVPGWYGFACAFGPAGCVDGLVGEVEGLVADGPVVEAPPVEAPAPELLEPPELPELLCAIAAVPDNNRATSIAAAFMADLLLAPYGSTNRHGMRSPILGACGRGDRGWNLIFFRMCGRFFFRMCGCFIG